MRTRPLSKGPRGYVRAGEGQLRRREQAGPLRERDDCVGEEAARFIPGRVVVFGDWPNLDLRRCAFKVAVRQLAQRRPCTRVCSRHSAANRPQYEDPVQGCIRGRSAATFGATETLHKGVQGTVRRIGRSTMTGATKTLCKGVFEVAVRRLLVQRRPCAGTGIHTRERDDFGEGVHFGRLLCLLLEGTRIFQYWT